MTQEEKRCHLAEVPRGPGTMVLCSEDAEFTAWRELILETGPRYPEEVAVQVIPS